MYDFCEQLFCILEFFVSSSFFWILISFAFLGNCLSFIFRIFRIFRADSDTQADLRRDKALQEFQKLTSSGETDLHIWNDFWERNEEFSKDIMKLK